MTSPCKMKKQSKFRNLPALVDLIVGVSVARLVAEALMAVVSVATVVFATQVGHNIQLFASCSSDAIP